MDADPKSPLQDGRSSAFHAAPCSVLPVLGRFNLLMADPPYGISAEYFAECLVRHNIVDAHALDDPEGYDGHYTLERIGEAYDEITQHLTARVEEALQKVKDVMEDIQSRHNAAPIPPTTL
jgi:hypothetical protein